MVWPGLRSFWLFPKRCSISQQHVPRTVIFVVLYLSFFLFAQILKTSTNPTSLIFLKFKNIFICKGHRLENRCVLRQILCLGNLLLQRKKNAICSKYATFEAIFFSFFHRQKIILCIKKRNTLESAMKSNIIWSYKKWQFFHEKAITVVKGYFQICLVG